MTAHFDNFTPPAPCDECEQAAWCAAEQLACTAFKAYTELGRWTDPPRDPTRELFVAIFRPRVRDEALLRQLRELRHATLTARGHRNGRRPGLSQHAQETRHGE